MKIHWENTHGLLDISVRQSRREGRSGGLEGWGYRDDLGAVNQVILVVTQERDLENNVSKSGLEARMIHYICGRNERSSGEKCYGLAYRRSLARNSWSSNLEE